MYNKIVANIPVDETTREKTAAAPPRIIPAGNVVIRPALKKALLTPPTPQVSDEPVVAKTVPETPTQKTERNLTPQEVSVAINQAVEEKVREFEVRFQSEKELAHREGFDQGKKKGYSEGLAAVKNLESLLNIIDGKIAADRADIISKSEKTVARLAVEIAEAVIGEAIMKSSRELLDFNLKRCLEVLGGSGKVSIKISPSDYEFAQEQLVSGLGNNFDKFSFEFLPDPGITPGGCLIETDGGAIDARIETQVDQIKQVFHQLV